MSLADVDAAAASLPGHSIPEEARVRLEEEEDRKEGVAPADLKVILLGDSAVGKSKLVERFLLDDYHARTRSTFALTLYRHIATVPSEEDPSVTEEVKVDIWDTAGQERFNSMHPSYYYGAHACILCFDVTRKSSYVNLNTWYAELRSYCEDIPCFVIANKIDVNYDVTKKPFAFAEKHNLPLYFVSAADGTNVVRVFSDAIEAGVHFKRSSLSFMAEVEDLLNDPDLGKGTAGLRTRTLLAAAKRGMGGGGGGGGGGSEVGGGGGGEDDGDEAGGR